jgi:peptidoglycan/LPS O-acetylase OafA/YrhL
VSAAGPHGGRSRRRLAPLALLWIAAVALGGWLWHVGDEGTVLDELLLPVAGALAAAALWRTGKWLRPRARGDRRDGDRRRQARRASEAPALL